ncbi:MAG: hypothetical protein ACYTG6_16830, partial [Planctomycetota bacterium]
MMNRRLVSGALAIALVTLAGAVAWAVEIDVTGTWQANTDCGSGIIGVSGWEFTEDTGTGVVAATLTECGTVDFEGTIRQFLSCPTTPSPIDGLVSGTSFAVPGTGFYNQDLLGFEPFASTGFPTCTALASANVDQNYTGIIQETGGIATRIDGFFGVDSFRLFNDDSTECWVGTCTVECCTLVLLRNDVSIGTGQTVEPFEDASVTFDNVGSSGTVAITPLTDPAGVVFPEFQVSDLALYYDVTTDVAFSGSITVCLPYPDDDDDGFVDGTTPPIDETLLRLLHEEGEVITAFVDRTSSLDTVANVICATTESLSQFVFGAATVTCGDGVVDAGEDCDEGLGANGDPTTCCTASCTFRTGGEVCRPSAGECDGTAETCSGAAGACPADTVAAAGTPCTDDGNTCTTNECDGFGVCGTVAGAGSCDDGDFCTTGDACNGVVCEGGPPPACSDGDPCTLDACVAGACVNPTAPDGTSCNDGDVCTGSDECEDGACAGSTPLCGTEVAVVGTKLIVVDKEEAAGKAKAVFVSKDGGITKGGGTDVGAIGAVLYV